MTDEPNTLTSRLLRSLPFNAHAWAVAAAVATGLVFLHYADVRVPGASVLMLGAVIIAASLGDSRSGLYAGLAGGAFEIFAGLSEAAMAPSGLLQAAPGFLLMTALGPLVGAIRQRSEKTRPGGDASRVRQLRASQETYRAANGDTHELDLVRERLVTSQDRLRDVTKRWIDAQEAERRKLARQLHDDIGQSLTALRINLESNKDRFAGDEDAKQFIESAYELVDRIIASVRELSLSLRPSLLDDFGLGAALREHVCQQLKRAGIHCKLHIRGDDGSLDETHAVAAYRIIQECMAGIQQRAQTDTVVLDVDFGDRRLEISIHEQGVSQRDEVAIASVRERAMLIGGALEVREGPRGDVILDFTIPYPNGASPNGTGGAGSS